MQIEQSASRSSEMLTPTLPPWRSHFITILLGLGFALLLARAYYLSTDPYRQLRANLITVNSPQDALVDLVRQADRLSKLSQNIDGVSIGTLKDEILTSIKIAERAALEFNAQSKAWSNLRGKIKDDSSTYEALRLQLSDLQRVQKDEIIRLSAMLDEAKSHR